SLLGSDLLVKILGSLPGSDPLIQKLKLTDDIIAVGFLSINDQIGIYAFDINLFLKYILYSYSNNIHACYITIAHTYLYI
ncbi:hypothetical protein ACJX0J_038986, partial [Zea mays]